MELRIDGLDDVLKKLRRLGENTKAVEGRRQVPIREVFTPAFMRQYTSVATFDELIAAGGVKVESAEDFAAIPDQDWESLVRRYTDFGTWGEMQQKAAEEYARRKLMSGL